MAAERPSVKKRTATGYMTFLASAPCEWILIFLLFIYAALTYFLTKFAQFCELKPPCLLCSRLDHVFGEKKSGCYWSSLCSSHREEISTLVSCAVHNKLADVNEMCEECFLPIAIGNKSNSVSCRLLVGKLWVDVERSALQTLMLNRHIKYSFSGLRTCSCCNKTWGAILNAERFHGFGSSVGFGASKAKVKNPLPRVLTRSHFSRRDSLKRLRDKFTGTVAHLSAVSSSLDTSAHVGNAKLVISSDFETEAIFYEDGGGKASSLGKNGSEHECDQYGGQCLPRAPGNKLALELKSNQGYEVKPLVPDAPNLLDLCENKNTHFPSSDAFEEQGLNGAEYQHKPSKFLIGELDAGRGSLSQTFTLPVLSELPPYNATPLFSTMMIPGQHADAVEGTSSDTVHKPDLDNMNPTDASTEGLENNELTSTHGLGHDYAENEEEMFLTKEFYTSEVSSSSKVTSPSASDEQVKSRTHEIPVSASLDRNDSDHHESSDGISDGDIIGEGIVDRLKRQVEHDQICINSLHQELEAERSAATIAANQAMAMITRLQEEKASLRMEALQYLRLMEEQAEYDKEAIERANDLLSEKEKELQDLETDLEFYRNNIVEESLVTHHTENSPRASTNDSISYHITKSNGHCKTMNNITKSNGHCKPMNSLVTSFADEEERGLQDLETELEFYRKNIVEESAVTHHTENSPRASTNESKSSNITESSGKCKPVNSLAPNSAVEKERGMSDLETRLEFCRNNIVQESAVTHHTENSPRTNTNDSKSSNITEFIGNCKPMKSLVPNFADEKERELPELESKLEFCRNNIIEESVVTHHTEISPRASTNYSKSSNMMESNEKCKPVNSLAPNFADEKERELQDLETKLEFCRNNIVEESTVTHHTENSPRASTNDS
ncbi:hypothetical protein F511_34761 [Dorcoceras hygrometricum]|uniref:GTD-binding domain-containing protein n=1 Tax=Dorcoceras hygrometricum TaxID=472368 RepID=A0A2Z7ATT9_9LAMI|nr:hypothetical protein F511_34761 [Dorcoceras hygrometricum]